MVGDNEDDFLNEVARRKGEIVVDESGAVDWNSQKVRSQLDHLLSE